LVEYAFVLPQDHERLLLGCWCANALLPLELIELVLKAFTKLVQPIFVDFKAMQAIFPNDLEAISFRQIGNLCNLVCG
jgi:hypothetical protein